jgi:hypothetical protein
VGLALFFLCEPFKALGRLEELLAGPIDRDFLDNGSDLPRLIAILRRFVVTGMLHGLPPPPELEVLTYRYGGDAGTVGVDDSPGSAGVGALPSRQSTGPSHERLLTSDYSSPSSSLRAKNSQNVGESRYVDDALPPQRERARH